MSPRRSYRLISPACFPGVSPSSQSQDLASVSALSVMSSSVLQASAVAALLSDKKDTNI